MSTEIIEKDARIHPLPVELANQIAAGEVVERPASVLKELLENSLDAKSTQIDIVVQKGGIQLIAVHDNGHGICKDDLPLAIASHATSKIQQLADLEAVQSYGFRGEALASIASVSRFSLSSAIKLESSGWSIENQGRETGSNNPVKLKPVAKRLGTSIFVKDLFYNTPARRKFLKSEKTETSYLEEVFKKMALSQFNVAFRFEVDDKAPKSLTGCRTLEAKTKRVARLCGKQFVENSHYVEAESNGLKLSGWISLKTGLRSQADLQYFYVNGRIVRDKVVMHAVRQAYQSIDVPGRYPAYILYLELDPHAVDVNVHPTKHEVRFREARTVHAFLTYAIQAGLENSQHKTQTKNPSIIKNFEGGLEYSEQPYFGTKSSGAVLSRTEEPFKITSLFNDDFLLFEKASLLYLIDVQKARQCDMTQQLEDAHTVGFIPRKPLLLPKSLLIPGVGVLLSKNPLSFEPLGFEWTLLSPDLLLVRAVPEVVSAAIENLMTLIKTVITQTTAKGVIASIVEYGVLHVALLDAEKETLCQKAFNQKTPFAVSFTAAQFKRLLEKGF